MTAGAGRPCAGELLVDEDGSPCGEELDELPRLPLDSPPVVQAASVPSATTPAQAPNSSRRERVVPAPALLVSCNPTRAPACSSGPPAGLPAGDVYLR